MQTNWKKYPKLNNLESIANLKDALILKVSNGCVFLELRKQIEKFAYCGRNPLVVFVNYIYIYGWNGICNIQAAQFVGIQFFPDSYFRQKGDPQIRLNKAFDDFCIFRFEKNGRKTNIFQMF